MKTVHFTSAILASSLFLLGACNDRDTGTPGGSKPKILATTTMLADLVRAIAADDFEVAGLMAPGVDPHTYEMPARAIAQIKAADAIFYNGHLLEGKMRDLLEPLAARGKSVIAVAESLPQESLLTPDGFEGHADPHVWGDVMLWKASIQPVKEALQHLRPDRSEAIAQRAAAYSTELAALDAWIRKRLGNIPENNRLIMTSHDAFNYFGRAYGVEVVGVQGISTATEAGLADIVSAVDLVKSRGVKAIFVESSVSRATIERIARDSGVTIGGELYSDSCGPAGQIENVEGESWDTGTYVGMMKHNVNVIAQALK